MSSNLPAQLIEHRIFFVRGHKVMFDFDLAALYQVPTGRLNEQVKRNLRRFPDDFMFRLNPEETNALRSHFAISKRGGSRYHPYAFTEQGVAMLSSVLSSSRAIDVNIAIMRAFVKTRKLVANHEELAKRIDALEARHNHNFRIVFAHIKSLMQPRQRRKSEIGFRQQGAG